MKFILLIVAMVAAGYGHPSVDLDILQRYLEEAVHEIDLNHATEKRDVQAVLDVMATMQPGQVSELEKPIKDMDTSVAASQTVSVIEAYFTNDGITDLTCVEILASMGTMQVVTKIALTPLRIRLISTVSRILILAVADDEAFSQVAVKLANPFLGMEETRNNAIKEIVEATGLPASESIKTMIGTIVTAVRVGLKTVDATTTGKTLVANVVQGVATAVNTLKPDINTATCDPVAVEAKLTQLETGLATLVAEATTLDATKAAFKIEEPTATEVHTAITSILTPDGTNGILTKINNAATTADVTEILVKNVFELAQRMITEKEEVTRLLAAAGSAMPDMATPAREAPIIEIIRTAIAGTSHLASTFGFDCEVPKLVSVIAGMIENMRLDFSLMNPVTTVPTRILKGLAKRMDPALDKELVAKQIATALSTFFDGIFKDAVLPLAAKLDTDFNNGVVFKSRNLALVLNSIFWVRRPNTLGEILQMALSRTLDAFDEVKSCPSEPNINMVDIRDFLEKALIDIETVASTRAVATTQQIALALGLDADTGDKLKELLLDTVKVMMPGLNYNLLEMQGELEIDATLGALRNTVGAQIGGQVYEQLWAANLVRSAMNLADTV